MANYSSKAERQAEDRKILAGVSKHITKNIVLNGASVSPKDLTIALQSVMTAEDACDDLRMKLSEAVKSQRAAEKSTKVLKASLKQYVIAHFGDSNPAITDFGYTPRKVAQKTVAEKYLTVEKQLATRAARHTMGSQQKAAIHGQVDAPAPQPQPAAAAPAPAPVAAPQPVAAPAPIAAPQPVVANGTSGAPQSVLSLNGSGH
jgi:hypothetical protein